MLKKVKVSKKWLSSEVNSVRPYKSRSSRPCDFCRKRKTCCIIQDLIPCMACVAFNRDQCTFVNGPIKRVSRKNSTPESPGQENPGPTPAKRKTMKQKVPQKQTQTPTQKETHIQVQKFEQKQKSMLLETSMILPNNLPTASLVQAPIIQSETYIRSFTVQQANQDFSNTQFNYNSSTDSQIPDAISKMQNTEFSSPQPVNLSKKLPIEQVEEYFGRFNIGLGIYTEKIEPMVHAPQHHTQFPISPSQSIQSELSKVNGHRKVSGKVINFNSVPNGDHYARMADSIQCQGHTPAPEGALIPIANNEACPVEVAPYCFSHFADAQGNRAKLEYIHASRSLEGNLIKKQYQSPAVSWPQMNETSNAISLNDTNSHIGANTMNTMDSTETVDGTHYTPQLSTYQLLTPISSTTTETVQGSFHDLYMMGEPTQNEASLKTFQNLLQKRFHQEDFDLKPHVYDNATMDHYGSLSTCSSIPNQNPNPNSGNSGAIESIGYFADPNTSGVSNVLVDSDSSRSYGYEVLSVGNMGEEYELMAKKAFVAPFYQQLYLPLDHAIPEPLFMAD